MSPLPFPLPSGRRLLFLLIGFAALCMVGIAAGRLIGPTAGSAEVQALTSIAGIRSPALTVIAKTLSVLGSSLFLIPLVAVALVWLWRRRRYEQVTVLVTTTVGAIGMAEIIKAGAGRLRPEVVSHLTDASSPSFPSQHALQSLAIYGVLALTLGASRSGRWSLLAAASLLAAGVALSRLYLGVHYPSDVIGGLLLAAGWLAVTSHFAATETAPQPPTAQ